MCWLCIVVGCDCVVVVTLFIAAPIVCVSCVLSWAVIVLLLFHCLLLPHCVCRLCIVLGGNCVVVLLLIAAPLCFGCVLSWAVIVL